MGTKTVTKTKNKENIEMVTIPKSEYEELKKDSEELIERKFHGPTMAREVIKSLKNGEKPVRIR